MPPLPPWLQTLLLSALGTLLALCLAALVLAAAGNTLLHFFLAALLRRILTTPYAENLWELVVSTERFGLVNVVETSLRAETGKALERPFGTPRRFAGFERLTFNFAQVTTVPLDEDVPVSVGCVIGPEAQHPLHLELPILVGGMATGLALSERAKVALARGTALAGTALSTGEGPYVGTERRAARFLILQWSRSGWAKSDEALAGADAVEIALGQGSRGGLGEVRPVTELTVELQAALGLQPDQPAVMAASFPEVAAGRLGDLVADLRRRSGGVPVGVKMAAGAELETDLDALAAAGVDFVALSAAKGGTSGSPAALEDNFGLPILYGLARAGAHFRARGWQGRISLIVAGGLHGPGDVLKALALGADAVYLGTAALLAMTHTQVAKTLPWAPPTQLLWYDGRFANAFEVRRGAQALARYLASCRAELEAGLRTMGKRSLGELCPGDLVALDDLAAAICGVRPAWQASESRPED